MLRVQLSSRDFTLMVVAVVTIVVIILLLVIVSAVKRRKIVNRTGVVVKDNVRYSADEKPIKYDDPIAVLNQGDIILTKGRDYVVGKDIKVGKYTVLTGQENISAVNVKINGMVKSIKNNKGIILADGDIICVVSNNIVLR